MNIYLLAILKILAACGAILILSLRFIGPLIIKSKQGAYGKALIWLLLPLATFSAVLYTDIGRSQQIISGSDLRVRFIHFHEQYHFFFGSKYLKELGYQNLYTTSMVAGIEEGNDFAFGSNVRDLRTFDMLPRDVAIVKGSLAKQNFSQERWEQYKTDLTQFDTTAVRTNLVSRDGFSNMMTDHGNTGSPAWALIAKFFTQFTAPSLNSMFFLGSLDYLLLIIGFILIGHTFGWLTGGLSLVAFALIPDLHGYIGGSILRYDWFFASILGFIWMKQGKYHLSGAAFGYAIVSKVFPVMFVVPLVIRAVADGVKNRRFKLEYRQFALSLLCTAALLFFVSSLFFGGFSIWSDYFGRLVSSFTQLPFVNQYGFRMAFLEIMSVGPLSYFFEFHGIPTYAISAEQTRTLLSQ
jgi:hypothetical protein